MSLSILLVDDESKMRLLLNDILEMEGYTVSEAADGATGLQQFNTVQPDLVLLDIVMPNGDGLWVLKAIRQQNSVVGILMVSGLQQNQMVRQAMASGADGYLPKPFRLQDLYQEVQRVSRMVYSRRYAITHHASWQSRRLFY